MFNLRDGATVKIAVGTIIAAIVGAFLMRAVSGSFAAAMFFVYILVFGIHIKTALSSTVDVGKQYGSMRAARGAGGAMWTIYAPVFLLFTVLALVELLSGFQFHVWLNPISVALFWYLPTLFATRLIHHREAGETLRQGNVTTATGQGVGGSALTAERDYTSAAMPTSTATSTPEAVQVNTTPSSTPNTTTPRRTVIQAEEE